MKICQVGAELFFAEKQANEWTDRYDKANNRFSQSFESA
jgi:hypothetical protein